MIVKPEDYLKAEVKSHYNNFIEKLEDHYKRCNALEGYYLY